MEIAGTSTCHCNDPKVKRLRKVTRITLFALIAIMLFLILNLYFNTAGAYRRELNTIFVFTKDYDATNTMYASNHEIGHYLYFNKLSQSQRDEYDRLFKDSNVYMSTYAMTNSTEDFAEMYTNATLCQVIPQLLDGQDENKIKFFYNNLEVLSK